MPPSQQLIPAAWMAAAHKGDQSSSAATKHTHAPIFLPVAIGNWRDVDMEQNPHFTTVFRSAASDHLAAPDSRESMLCSQSSHFFSAAADVPSAARRLSGVRRIVIPT